MDTTVGVFVIAAPGVVALIAWNRRPPSGRLVTMAFVAGPSGSVPDNVSSRRGRLDVMLEEGEMTRGCQARLPWKARLLPLVERSMAVVPEPSFNGQ